MMVALKGEIGVLTPIICCKEHGVSRHGLYDLCETDEVGEVSSVMSLIHRRCSLSERASCKCIAGRTSKRLFPKHMHCCGRLCG